MGERDKEMSVIKSMLGALSIIIVSIVHTYAQENPSNVIQEDESSEVFLEEYTDEFQEMFFEALKQKGIENYDRAINLLLDCKQLELNNTAVTHELAKTYLLDKQWISAKQYALEAVQKEPDNFWYLNTLIMVLSAQSDNYTTVKGSIAYDYQPLRKNLAAILVKNKKYNDAKQVLKGVKDKEFALLLSQKIEDQTKAKKTVINTPSKRIAQLEKPKKNPTQQLIDDLKNQIAANNSQKVLTMATEAIESFPLQPYFYYAKGWALNKTGKPNEALEVLQSGLDFLFEEGELQSQLFKEMANAHQQLGNESKANEYLSKVKATN